MSKLLILFLGAALCCSTAYAQRYLDYVGNIGEASQSIVLNNKVFLAGNNENVLRIFSGASLTTVEYPMVSGTRLQYRSTYQLAVFGGNVYIVLWNATTPYLYRFNGTTFTPVTIPGTMVTGCVNFGSLLYFMSNDAGTIKLFSYNGTAATAVLSATMPVTGGDYDLKAAGDFLYLIGNWPRMVKRYNGSAVTTLPSFTFSRIEQIIPVPGTGNVYFKLNRPGLAYYNGSTVTTIYDAEGGSIYAVYAMGALFFVATFDPTVDLPYLYRAVGATVTGIPLPPGNRLLSDYNIVTYEGDIYLGVTYAPYSGRVLRYNGSFTEFFNIPGEVRSVGRFYVREGKLLIHPRVMNDHRAWEYDGATFTEIIGPSDRVLAQPMGSSSCYHLWVMHHFEVTNSIHSLVAESKGCLVLVVPELIEEYQMVDVSMITQGRTLNWSRITLNWQVQPVCPTPPCPSPAFNIVFRDLNNNIAWQNTFDKPFVAQVPLKDDQSYKVNIDLSGNPSQSLFVFHPNLVPKGIKEITLNMKPKEEFFKLTAATTGVQVPLKIELLDKAGNILWEKIIVTPCSVEIKDKIEKRGHTLRFSVPENLLVNLPKTNLSSLSFQTR